MEVGKRHGIMDETLTTLDYTLRFWENGVTCFEKSS